MLRFSAGTWMWWLMYAGTLCDEDIGVCEQQRPCQNGGVCERHNGGFRCLCSQKSQNGRLYGGQTCAVALSGCDDGRCENGGVCLPLLVRDQHAYSCVCLAGFSGRRCQTPTTFSLERSGGYLRLETRGPRRDPKAPLRLTFGFRTRGPAGTLLQCRAEDLLLTVELLSGRLRLSSRRGQGSSVTLVQELRANVSDGEWHVGSAGSACSAQVVVVVEVVVMMVVVMMLVVVVVVVVVVVMMLVVVMMVVVVVVMMMLVVSVSLGAAGLNPGVESPAAFSGCFRDVVVDSRLVAPGDLGSESDVIQVNVTMGCSDEDKCEAAPCGGRGRCVPQGWRSYRCVCHRPYRGVDCQEEHVPATFGSDALDSYAVFTLVDHPPHTLALDHPPHTLALDHPPNTLALDHPPHPLVVSMFVRTRRASGLLLVLANSTSQYLRVWLEEGRVKVQVNNLESATSRAAADDGHFHLLTVRLEDRVAVLSQASHVQASIATGLVQARHGDRVFIGGLPDPRAPAAFGGYFKGCVQDLRINGRPLQFFPIPGAAAAAPAPAESHRLEQLTRVTRGCSSDDTCAGKPCLNGGLCYATREDFSCSCPPGTAGRRCEEVVRWCERSPCPSSAVCAPLPRGFQCEFASRSPPRCVLKRQNRLSNVTLRGGAGGGVLSYRGNGRITRRLTGVVLRLRTRQTDATLLQARRGPARLLTVSLRRSHLAMELLRADGAAAAAPAVSVRTAAPVADGRWHTVELRMETPGAESSRWVAEEVEADAGGRAEARVSEATGGSLDFLREGVDILLGGGGDSGGGLDGCLGPLEIGGIPLPFHTDGELSLPRPQEEQFLLGPGAVAPSRLGCRGADVCSPNPCGDRGGACEDLFDLSRCRCPPGWTGPLCQDPTDACHPDPCLRGNCTTASPAAGTPYECACEPGYAGSRCEAEAEADTCADHRCSAGATCLRGAAGYGCLCPRNMTGRYCG
ncbi:Protein crumbs 1 [Merluccius polli]|uniref:Protein crumbs 1 n=1 Tax=Merluccius polli TaxID=89951 RepID=A0AA47NAQ9_MERPO|nr:Protein crumbs 1 [Merluccius polli]